jgi:hypothetical protein
MEPEGSLQHSHKPSTGPYTEPDQSNPYHQIHFNIIHPFTNWSSLSSLSYWLSHQYPLCSSLLSYSCYMNCPLILLDRSNYTWRRVHVMDFLILLLSPASCHSISHLPKEYVGDQLWHLYRTAGKITVLQTETLNK